MKLKRLARTLSAQQRVRTAAEQAELRALEGNKARLAKQVALTSVHAERRRVSATAAPSMSCRDKLNAAKQLLALALSTVSTRSELYHIGYDVLFEIAKALQTTPRSCENWAGFDDRGKRKPSWPALIAKIESADSIGSRLLNRWEARRLNDCDEVAAL